MLSWTRVQTYINRVSCNQAPSSRRTAPLAGLRLLTPQPISGATGSTCTDGLTPSDWTGAAPRPLRCGVDWIWFFSAGSDQMAFVSLRRSGYPPGLHRSHKPRSLEGREPTDAGNCAVLCAAPPALWTPRLSSWKWPRRCQRVRHRGSRVYCPMFVLLPHRCLITLAVCHGVSQSKKTRFLHRMRGHPNFWSKCSTHQPPCPKNKHTEGRSQQDDHEIGHCPNHHGNIYAIASLHFC